MATDVALIKRLGVEFTSLSDVVILDFINLAKEKVPPGNKWRNTTMGSGYTDYDMAIAWVALHLMQTSGSTPSDASVVSTSEVTTEKVGDLSTTYANNSSTSGGSTAGTGGGSYNSTRFGREFLQMLRGIPKSPMIIS